MTTEYEAHKARLHDIATAHAAKAIRKIEADNGLPPRRVDIKRNTPEEKLIRMAVVKVEDLGAHPMLTRVVTLLDEARNVLADWIDGERYDLSKPR
jgi:hypothetical protein